ncbi:short-chain dehydrogenase/reductase [Enterovirga sp. CN4-39]|uniref:short-chain dehydrogenase/reductase n=1 Tax=Enterovirga sp. CN4-39 TaxID=3400910 RepID=UPI003C0E5F07
MDLGLSGSRALITGANAGIGLAVARLLAEEGCDLLIAARNRDRLEAVAGEIRAAFGVVVEPIAVDLSISEQQRELVAAAGDVDILVNNAGSNPGGEIDAISEEVWRKSWDLKVFGYINLIREIYPRMKERRRGVIVNVIGNSGERMNSKYILGSSGNIALMGLTQALGGRSPDFGVRVVGVNPGMTRTDRASFLLRGWSESRFGTPDRADEVLADMDVPFGRMAEPSEIAAAVAFLASARAAYISGTILTVDGGATHRN